MEPFLTIIIPVYKIKEEYLYQCLNSLAGQSDSLFRVILIDDGSPDHCGRICDTYTEKDPRFFVIHQTNQGVSEARNAGIQLVTSEWTVFVDADDWVEATFVEVLHKNLNNYDADIYVYDYYNEIHGKPFEKKLRTNAGILDEEWKKQLRLAPFHFLKIDGKKLSYVSHAIWNKMFRTSLLKRENILFNRTARRGEDSLFLAEALQCAGQICYIDVPLYHYRRQFESATNAYNQNILQENSTLFREKEQLILKYHLSMEYREALDANICTSLYSCMRLWIFHHENHVDKEERRREINRILDAEPYKTAFKKVNFHNLTTEQKIFVFLFKYHQIAIVEFLTWLRRKIKGMG